MANAVIATDARSPARPAATKPLEASVNVRKTEEPRAAQPRALAGEDRYRLIAERAYFKAEERGFAPGGEVADWLAAEIEIDDLLGTVGDRA